jgi:hypothetical protein
MKSSAVIFLLLVTASVSAAQTSRPTVYVESKDEFANDFSAGVIRKNVPVTLTADRQQAGYVARFTWATNEGSKTRGIMTTLATGIYLDGSYERVSMTIVERKTKNLIYSYTCQKGGRHVQSVAECLAKHWKDELGGGKITMREFQPTELAGIEDGATEAVSVRKEHDAVPVQIIEHPAEATQAAAQQPETGSFPQNTIASDVPTESVADAARRMKADKAARAKAANPQR